MTDGEKQGFFKRAKNAIQEAYAEDKAKREAAPGIEKAFYEKAANEYGRLVESATFDSRRIEIFDKGYVRVGGYLNTRGGPERGPDGGPYVVAYDTPFEKLRGIKFATQIQDKSAGGRAVASAASMGLSKMASNEKRVLFLTITTAKEVYALKDSGDALRLTDKFGMRLEAAGQGVLDSIGSPTETAVPAASVNDQLRDLAALHADGVLSDDEFVSAKAKLLGAD